MWLFKLYIFKTCCKNNNQQIKDKSINDYGNVIDGNNNR